MIVAFEASKELIDAAETSKISTMAFDTSRKPTKPFVIVALETLTVSASINVEVSVSMVALDTSRFVMDPFGVVKDTSAFTELAVRGPRTTADPSIDAPVTVRFVSVGDVPTETRPELNIIKRPDSVIPQNHSVSTTVFMTEFEDRRPDI